MNLPRGIVFALALVIAIFSTFYAFFALSESPPTWFDEGIYIQVAQSLGERGVQTLQVAPGVYEGSAHVTGGYTFLAPAALSMSLFGDPLLSARLPMAIFIVLTVLSALALIWRLFGAECALWAGALLTTLPLLYGNGKNVLGEVPGMLFTILALYFLWRIEASGFRGTQNYILSGLLVGLAVATKPIFLLLPLAVGVVFLARMRSIPFLWRDILYATLAMLFPLLIWAYLQFGGAESPGSLLFHYANPYAESNLLHTVFENIFRFFTEATPMYMAGLFGAWVLSVVVRLYRKVVITNAEWVAFTFSLLILLAYLRTAGWYRYFFETLVLSLVFLPFALRTFIPKKYVWVPLLLLLCLQFYQLNFSSWVADSYQSTKTKELTNALATLPEGSVFVYNAPELVPFLPHKNFYQYFDIEPTGALGYGKMSLPALQNKTPDIVLTTPHALMQQSTLFGSYSESASFGGYILLTRR